MGKFELFTRAMSNVKELSPVWERVGLRTLTDAQPVTRTYLKEII